MMKTANEFVKTVEEVRDLIIVESLNSDNLKDMSEADLKAIKFLLRLIDVSNELIKEQAESLEKINDKLDKLLETKETKES